MALRYLALLRYPRRENSEMADDYQGLGLSHSIRTEALHVFTNAPALPLPGRIGAIVGDLFTREDQPTPVRTFNDREARVVRRTAGERLLTGYWGGYVAFIEDERGVLHVMRDPSAAVPCYYLKLEGGIAFSSDVDLLVEAGLLTGKPDFGFLARHLSAPDIRTPDTGLVGLKELRGGFRMSVNGAAHTISEAWSPWAHTEPKSRATDGALVQELQNTVMECVSAWSRRYPRSLLGVSGGLDSSIVAASLVSAGANLTTVTLATNEAEGDERAFARILRDHLNIPLVEAFHRADLVDFTRPLSHYLPRPIGHAFAQSNFGIRFELEKRLGIDAFFSGIGGDNVFCYTQSATALVDRFRAEGFNLGLTDTLNDICRQNNASVGSVLKMAVRRHLKSDGSATAIADTKFLSAAALDRSASTAGHPWLNIPKGALPGKAVHVAMLTTIHGTIDGLPRNHAPQILPLLSQPIVELCLGIPMWKWIAGGRNRSVARAAFAKSLPKALIERQSKGGPDSFAYTVMEQNKAVVRERLTTGRLAAEGLIDLSAIAEAMDSRRLIAAKDHMRLSDLSECESWVRYWEAKA